MHDDRPLVAAERRRRRDALQADERGPDADVGRLLDFVDRLGLALEHDVADRGASRVEADHERRHRAGRHERAGPVHLGHHLGHGLHHVGAGMEEDLHLREALDIAALDVMNARDVEEVVLVVEGEQRFHLRRVHAAVGLHDVDHRQVQIREDVDLHPTQGQPAADDQPGQCNHDGNWSAQGKRERAHDRAVLAGGRRSTWADERAVRPTAGENLCTLSTLRTSKMLDNW